MNVHLLFDQGAEQTAEQKQQQTQPPPPQQFADEEGEHDESHRMRCCKRDRSPKDSDEAKVSASFGSLKEMDAAAMQQFGQGKAWAFSRIPATMGAASRFGAPPTATQPQAPPQVPPPLGRKPSSEDEAPTECMDVESLDDDEGTDGQYECASTIAPTEFERCFSFGSEALEDSHDGSIHSHSAKAPRLGPRDDVVYDVIADTEGAMLLLPACGPDVGRMDRALRADDLPGDTVVTIRTFRFFEDKSDEKFQWERELRNVNSGSLLWAVVHMQPKMHSVAGGKYGEWLTIHHVRVKVGGFKMGYHMAQEGSCPFAKGFGATVAVKGLVTGSSLPTGYYWFVSPDRQGSGPSVKEATSEENLESLGWQHVCRYGPFDGHALMQSWQMEGSPLEECRVQQLVQKLSG